MWWVACFAFLWATAAVSTDCGNLIALDGYRYNLLPLAGVHTFSYNESGVRKNVRFSICGVVDNHCGDCTIPGICENSVNGEFCNGVFTMDRMDPLLHGVGVVLHYEDGDLGSAYLARETTVTIVCDPRDGVNDVEMEGVEPIFSLRMKSSAGCPASGTGTVTFPYEYAWYEYIYKGDPKTGHISTIISAGSYIQKLEKRGKTVIDYEKLRLYNWGDRDQYHFLSCYWIYIPNTIGFPWGLPTDATFAGTSVISVWDPTTNTTKTVLTDGWKYDENRCTNMIWFEHGKAIPVKQTNGCTEQSIVYYNADLGQPDGSYFKLPAVKCHPYLTCGWNWNTCKDPLCCSNNRCVPCE